VSGQPAGLQFDEKTYNLFVELEANQTPAASIFTVRIKAGERVKVSPAALIGASAPILPAGRQTLKGLIEIHASSELELIMGGAAIGDAVALDVGDGLRCVGSAIIAMESGVTRSSRPLPGGWWQLEGSGEVIVGATGPIEERDIPAGESFFFDQRCVLGRRGGNDSSKSNPKGFRRLFDSLLASSNHLSEIHGPATVYYYSGRALSSTSASPLYYSVNSVSSEW
jgi:uncharacterized protein (AIM24 family)